jgi:hypothetical protein
MSFRGKENISIYVSPKQRSQDGSCYSAMLLCWEAFLAAPRSAEFRLPFCSTSVVCHFKVGQIDKVTGKLK